MQTDAITMNVKKPIRFQNIFKRENTIKTKSKNGEFKMLLDTS